MLMATARLVRSWDSACLCGSAGGREKGFVHLLDHRAKAGFSEEFDAKIRSPKNREGLLEKVAHVDPASGHSAIF